MDHERCKCDVRETYRDAETLRNIHSTCHCSNEGCECHQPHQNLALSSGSACSRSAVDLQGTTTSNTIDANVQKSASNLQVDVKSGPCCRSACVKSNRETADPHSSIDNNHSDGERRGPELQLRAQDEERSTCLEPRLAAVDEQGSEPAGGSVILGRDCRHIRLSDTRLALSTLVRLSAGPVQQLARTHRSLKAAFCDPQLLMDQAAPSV